MVYGKISLPVPSPPLNLRPGFLSLSLPPLTVLHIFAGADKLAWVYRSIQGRNSLASPRQLNRDTLWRTVPSPPLEYALHMCIEHLVVHHELLGPNHLEGWRGWST